MSMIIEFFVSLALLGLFLGMAFGIVYYILKFALFALMVLASPFILAFTVIYFFTNRIIGFFRRRRGK